jgi:hypothetical protein
MQARREEEAITGAGVLATASEVVGWEDVAHRWEVDG